MHLIEGMRLVERVVKTRSYVAFMRMTSLASLLLFAYLNVRKLEEDAASGAAGGSSV